MPLCKILKLYANSENWKPGQIVDVTNPWTLIKEGKVILVDEKGKEIEHPDLLMQIRNSVTSTEALELIGQILSRHPKRDVLMKALREAGEEEKAKKEDLIPGEEIVTIEPVAAVEATTPEEIDEVVANAKRREMFDKASSKIKIK
jgi:hypothetical protein